MSDVLAPTDKLKHIGQSIQVRGWAARFALKHSPQSTGRPDEGLNGTLSVLPH